MPAEAVVRVLLVSPESTGGIGRHVRMLAAELTKRGHQVTVAAPPATIDRFAVRDVASTSPLQVRRLRRLAAAHDVVHAHGVRMGAAAAMVRARPLVTTWHNAPLGGAGRRTLHAALERVSSHGSAVVLGASADLVERAQRSGARDARLCPVVAPPRVVVRRPPAPDATPTLLAVARLHPQKRLDLLVDAVSGWEGRVQVVVAGDGPLRDELRARAQAAGAPVELVGAREDVADLLATASALVLPSEWEARPLVVQEALAAGVPVVATRVGGVPDLVGDAALLVPPGDVAALRDALERLLGDPQLQRQLADAGPRRAATWPDLTAMVDLVESAYATAMSPQAGARRA